MRTLPALRKRFPSEPVTGGLRRIFGGVFGVGNPVDRGPDLSPPTPGLYHFHEGDLFTPGTGNYVFEPPFELPLQAWWGAGGAAQGFARVPNVFNPLQPPQVYSNPMIRTQGMGGLQAGQFELQPLEFPSEEHAG